MRQCLHIATALLVLTLLSGCYLYRTGSTERQATPAPLSADAWPARDLEAVRPLLEATPKRIFRYELRPRLTLDDVDPQFAPYIEAEPDYTVHYADLHGRGLVRQFTEHFYTDDPWLPDELLYGFRPNARFLTSRTVESPIFQAELAEAREKAASPQAMFKKTGVRVTHLDDLVALDHGKRLKLPIEIPEQPRGVLIHFTAMFGSQYERRVVGTLRERGWVVLSIDTNPWISAPLRPDLLPRIEALEAQRDEVEQAQRAVRGALAAAREEANSAAVERLAAQDARLLERLRATWSEIADLRRGAFQVCAASDVEPVAADIAARVDDVTAEHAYAAEAVLGYVHSRFPQLAAAPVAVIGFSAGALVAPAAAVLLEEEVDAVVLIGGGANYLAIGTRSEFSDGGLRLDCRGEPVPQPLMQALERAYLERTRLDPYVLAPHLRGQPVLLVRATHDAWVPADTGEALQQQLGDPDRLVHVGGHKTLFYFLPTQSTRIARWLERAVER